MPLQDSNPERRNLSVLSLAFLGYFWGGGHFTSGQIKLFVIDASFARPWVLALMAWAMLLWFFYRYWLLHWGTFLNAFFADSIERSKGDARLKALVIDGAKKILEPGCEFDDVDKVHLAIRDEKWLIGYRVRFQRLTALETRSALSVTPPFRQTGRGEPRSGWSCFEPLSARSL